MQLIKSKISLAALYTYLYIPMKGLYLSRSSYNISNKDKYSEPQMSVLFKYITKETDNTNKIQNEN